MAAWKRCVIIPLERDLNENRRGGDGSECKTERDERDLKHTRASRTRVSGNSLLCWLICTFCRPLYIYSSQVVTK